MTRAILHISYIDMLIAQPIEHWIENFSVNSGSEPTEVVLPAMNHSGPIFPGIRLNMPDYVAEHPEYQLQSLIQEVRQHLPNAKIWCSINPTLALLGSLREVQVIDNHGGELERNACITNPVVHSIIDDIIGGIVAAGGDDVHGVVFQATDIYPQAASDRVTGEIQNTCFCNHCLAALKVEGYREGTAPFVKRHPERLALRIDNDGVANIVIDLHPTDGTASEWLYKNAVAQNFVSADEPLAEKLAGEYVKYLRARVEVTAKQIKRLGQKAQENGLQRAVIIGDVNLDLTTMVDLRTIDKHQAVDEVWTGSTNDVIVRDVNTPVIKFLFVRGTYIIDTFFERFYTAEHLIKRGEQADTVRGYMSRLAPKFIGANLLSGNNVMAVSYMDWLAGFIALPVFTFQDVNELIDKFLEIRGLGIGSSSTTSADGLSPEEVIKNLRDRMNRNP